MCNTVYVSTNTVLPLTSGEMYIACKANLIAPQAENVK